MSLRRLTFLFLLIFNLQTANAATFIVTSNADSGPGTLREAISLANGNGSVVYDTILFNIADASQSGRTINLTAPLPALTSRLVIDASQQSGAIFGVSTAKIILSFPGANLSFSYFEINNCSNVEIYSIFFLQPVLPTNILSTGISIIRSDTIRIGSPGKGNYFLGCQYGIRGTISYSPNDSSHFIKIKSNIIGLNEFGIATDSFQNNHYGYFINSLLLRNFEDVEIGGNSTAEGNKIGASTIFIVGDSYQNGLLDIRNNYFGTNSDGTENMYNPNDCWLTINPGFHDDLKVTFTNNILNGRLFLLGLGQRRFIVQSNIIFSKKIQSATDFRISMQSCTNGLIGGDTPAEGNYIYSNYNNPYYYFTPYSKQTSIRNDASVVTIRNNITLCNSYWGSGIEHYLNGYNPSTCQIDSTGINFVKGKATPNTRIDVYLDDDCLACEGKEYLGFTFSNSDSTWSFTGSFSQTVVATSTNSFGTTSEFSQPIVFPTDMTKVKNPSCGQNNGSIKNMQTKGADNVIWHKFMYRNNVWIDSIISTTLDISNLGPGKYVIEARLGVSCRSAFQIFDLNDITPLIDEANALITHPNCGLFNGSVTNILIYNYQQSIIEWKDFQGNIISNQLVLSGVGAGMYKLYLRDTTIGGGCIDSTNWFMLTNQSGPSLNTNNIQITSATCTNSNGNINNITASNVTGTPFIRWVDTLNIPVGNSLNLQNVPAGKYRLKFKDQSSCDTIITPFYIVPGVGIITIDTTAKIIIPAGCTVNNGSIQNIQIAGADALQWINLTNNLPVGVTANIYNLASGNYQLTATNTIGCSSTVTMFVPQAAFMPIGVTGVQSRNAICGENNGMIIILSFNNNQALYSFRWVDSTTAQVIATGTSVLNLSGGTYLLFATDTNGCEKQIYKNNLGAYPKPGFDYSAMRITNDQCSSDKGGITGITVTGLFGPTTYTWENINNTISGNLLNLNNVGADQYRLIVTDGGVCTVYSDWITILNDNALLQPPQYPGQTIVKNTNAVLTIMNFQPGTYFLYSDPGGTQELQQNNSGVFTTGNLTTDTYFYVKRILGSCSSQIVPIKINVIDKTGVYIPTAFSPNNDGKNDQLKVIAYGPVTLKYFTIYDRWGGIIFTTNHLNTGWDGKFKGVQMDTGIFVWVVKAIDELTGAIIEQKGTVSLIR